jgi:signal transduction histidine kinase
MAETSKLATSGRVDRAADARDAQQADRARGVLHLPILGGRIEAFRWVAYLLIVTSFIFHIADQSDRGWLHWIAWCVAIAAFTLMEGAWARLLSRDLGELYIILRVALAAWVVWLTRVDFISSFLFFIVVTNGWEIGRRAGIVATIGSTVAIFSVLFAYIGLNEPRAYITLLPWLAGLAFIGGATQLAKRERESRKRSEALLVELGEAHRRLQDYADQASQLATTQERNRIAREIHDSLGHYLTIINVQLETAQAFRSRDAERADRAVGEAKRLASEALADVRRSVAALRPSALENLSVRQAIEQQVADFRAHSGLAVELAIEGDEARCSQAAGLALYRAVQEGLTNIRKHADATHVAVRLNFGPATAELTIADDGRGLPADLAAGPRPDGGGFGLAGIRERMALLGGTLDVRPGQRSGTELRATLPCSGAH